MVAIGSQLAGTGLERVDYLVKLDLAGRSNLQSLTLLLHCNANTDLDTVNHG